MVFFLIRRRCFDCLLPLDDADALLCHRCEQMYVAERRRKAARNGGSDG